MEKISFKGESVIKAIKFLELNSIKEGKLFKTTFQEIDNYFQCYPKQICCNYKESYCSEEGNILVESLKYLNLYDFSKETRYTFEFNEKKEKWEEYELTFNDIIEILISPNDNILNLVFFKNIEMIRNSEKMKSVEKMVEEQLKIVLKNVTEYVSYEKIFGGIFEEKEVFKEIRDFLIYRTNIYLGLDNANKELSTEEKLDVALKILKNKKKYQEKMLKNFKFIKSRIGESYSNDEIIKRNMEIILTKILEIFFCNYLFEQNKTGKNEEFLSCIKKILKFIKEIEKENKEIIYQMEKRFIIENRFNRMVYFYLNTIIVLKKIMKEIPSETKKKFDKNISAYLNANSEKLIGKNKFQEYMELIKKSIKEKVIKEDKINEVNELMEKAEKNFYCYSIDYSLKNVKRDFIFPIEIEKMELEENFSLSIYNMSINDKHITKVRYTPLTNKNSLKIGEVYYLSMKNEEYKKKFETYAGMYAGNIDGKTYIFKNENHTIKIIFFKKEDFEVKGIVISYIY